MSSALQNRKSESYKIFDQIAGTYDLLNRLLSFGIDTYWRKKMLKKLPQAESIEALDLATGTGDVPLVLIKDKRVKRILGLDMSKGMIGLGQEKIKKAGLNEKIELRHGDGVEIPCEDETFDLTTISFGIRNFSSPQTSLENIHRVLRNNGRLLIMEFSLPKSKIVRSLYFLYFRHILPFVGNLLSKHKDAYSYLNESVEDFPYGEEFCQLMEGAGFVNVGHQPLTFGIATLYYGDKIK